MFGGGIAASGTQCTRSTRRSARFHALNWRKAEVRGQKAYQRLLKSKYYYLLTYLFTYLLTYLRVPQV